MELDVETRVETNVEVEVEVETGTAQGTGIGMGTGIGKARGIFHNSLKLNEEVILIQQGGGQLYTVIGRVGHDS